MGDLFNAMRMDRKAQRAAHGQPYPECVRLLPRTHPAILLPGQRCRIHGYRDPRPRLPDPTTTD